MDYVISILILSTIVFSITIFKAKRYDINIFQNIIEFIIYSFIMASGITFSISLITYALTGTIILGLTNDILRVAVLFCGVISFVYELKKIIEKFDDEKLIK